MIPCFASIAAWAFEPAMSCAKRRLSKPIEALISSMIASGPELESPAPHLVGHRNSFIHSRKAQRMSKEKKPGPLGQIAAGLAVLAAITGIYLFQAEGRKAGPGDARRPPPSVPGPAGISKDLATGTLAAFLVKPEPARPGRCGLPGRRGQAAEAERLEGPGGAGQSLGHLVRAMPQGNAGPGEAPEGTGLGRLRGGGDQCRPQGRGSLVGLSEGNRCRQSPALRRADDRHRQRHPGRLAFRPPS